MDRLPIFSKHFLAALLLACAFGGGSASAGIIDFEDVATLSPPHPAPLLPGQEGNLATNIVSQGFNVSWLDVLPGFPAFGKHAHIANAAAIDGSADLWVPNNGTAYAVTDDSANLFPNTMTITPVSGVPFSIQAVNLAEKFGPTKSAQSVLITGFFFGGGSISMTVVLDEIATLPNAPATPLFQLVPFGAAWVNLTSVVFDGNGSPDTANGDYWAVDNIVVNAPVPEPSSIGAFCLGLLGLTSLARRRRAMA